jgi:ribosomal protein S18 acetylase RimI-like enzyme
VSFLRRAETAPETSIEECSAGAVGFYESNGWRAERTAAVDIFGVRFDETLITKRLVVPAHSEAELIRDFQEPVMASHIRRAMLVDLGLVAPLFDGYRQFYGKPSDPPLAEAFMRDRLERDESVVFLAIDAEGGEGLGFVQLYPSFSSVSARPIWILNDLYVIPAARNRGLGRALLAEAAEHARSTGAARLVLSTATDNRTAQSLYESYGFRRDERFLVYQLELGS